MTISSLAVRQAAQRLRLPNGLTLLLAQNPTVDIVAARLFFPAGSYVESPEKAGLASLVASVLTKGTSSRDSQAIASCVESLGAAIGVDSSADYFEVSLKSLAEDLPQVLALVAEILRDPIFPEAEVWREQQLMLQAIRSQQERPFSVAYDQLRQILYDNHPYAFSHLGKASSLGSLTRQDLQTYHAQHLRPDSLIMAVVGPLPADQLAELIASHLGSWISAPPARPPARPPALPPRPQGSLCTTGQTTQQSTVMLGYRGCAVGDPDYAPLKVLATYLGSGLSSRLFVELREKRGLAYEVSAFFATRRDPAPFVAYLGTAADNTQTALAGLQAELDRLHQHPLSPSEVAVCQRKVLGQYALSKQTNAQIAQMLGWYEVLQLGMEFDQTYPSLVKAVTPQSLHRVAQTYLTDPVISLVGPESALAEVSVTY
ncbi:MAG: pitrilysin family protein [Cyanobacteriota bacterium]|nr:pitrilysin family protein [Cyanobacteriota bacterium]